MLGAPPGGGALRYSAPGGRERSAVAGIPLANTYGLDA